MPKQVISPIRYVFIGCLGDLTQPAQHLLRSLRSPSTNWRKTVPVESLYKLSARSFNLIDVFRLLPVWMAGLSQKLKKEQQQEIDNATYLQRRHFVSYLRELRKRIPTNGPIHIAHPIPATDRFGRIKKTRWTWRSGQGASCKKARLDAQIYTNSLLIAFAFLFLASWGCTCTEAGETTT